MATRLFLHHDTNSLSGTFPTTEQTSFTPINDSMEAQTVCRTMNTTKGTSQASISKSLSLSIGGTGIYHTRFISEAINQTSITAQTWTINFASKTGNNGALHPGTCRPNIYVWRPSTGAKVGTIVDANASTSFVVNQTNEGVRHTTISGSAVTCQVNDVIIFELLSIDGNANGTFTCFTYYDGATENTTQNASVSDHASFIETPQNIAFITGGGGGEVDCTVTGKTIATKQIIHG